MTSTLIDAYIAALAAMDKIGRPLDLNGLTADQAKYLDLDSDVDGDFLRTHLDQAGPNDPLRAALRSSTARWDAAVGPAWAEGTAVNTPARRDVIVRHLKLDEKTAVTLNDRCPVAGVLPPTVIAREWSPWYVDAAQARSSFYWASYEGYLRGKNWESDAIAALDIATDRVVERLTNPTQTEAYKAKGLVVGHVQSGKTANFTGVVAKAIDAGYRLIIVLTGTTDLLRAQTQRRLDMELVGRENILAGIDENDLLATDGLDYQSDPAWKARKFLQHGTMPRHAGQPNIHRLTTERGDYKSLKTGILALDFPRRNEGKPIYDPENLFSTDARLAVVKKNASVLTKLVADLKKTAARIEDLPTLIIDDESDQASVNTSNPKKWQEDQVHRTAINRLISQLLGMLPRAQYVGYTATPFANVFIDPSDAEDIFPNDFLISLNRTPGYMGATDFHDLDSLSPSSERSHADSNEKAYVRLLDEDGDDDRDLRQAMDTFVLTGAVKLYRQSRGEGPFEHHTMLVHENMRTSVHREQADRIRALWDAGGYYSTSAHERLCRLFDTDLLPVMQARADGAAIPADYASLVPFVAEAVARIGATDNPVLIVNSDKIEGEKLAFDQDEVWRILVGGNKLARGFTVEGLTVSYYRRLTKQGDTLMQMGRWFGYRKAYRDLVRLYITEELHTAFEAICRDEEFFRRELKRYSETTVDGKPQITPAQVPPLVAQHLPWLKPTATNKMYNARLIERRSPGVGVEPTGYPRPGEDLTHNVKSFLPLLELAAATETFKSSQNTSFQARFGIAPRSTFLTTLESLRWVDEQAFRPDLAWLKTLTEDRIRDWAVILPQQADDVATRRILTAGLLSVYVRQRRRDPYFGAISDPKHRHAAEIIAGGDKESALTDANALSWRREDRGAIIVYPLVDTSSVPGVSGDDIAPSTLVVAFRVLAPPSSRPADGRLLKFVTKNALHAQAAIVDSQDEPGQASPLPMYGNDNSR